MSFFKRFGIGGPEKAKPQPKPKEQEIIFEEVGEEEPADFTYREDSVGAMVENILALEADLEEARAAMEGGEGDKASLAVREVLLAKARYEQAAANERMGRSQKGEADRLLEAWQQTQNRLDALREDQLQDARDAILSRYDDDIDADTAAQLRRHA